MAAPETEALGLSILNETQRNTLFHNRSVDLSKGFQGLNRFRFNVFYQRGAIALVARLIPYRIPSFGELGLPPIVKQFALCPHGLVLVTGPAGSGRRQLRVAGSATAAPAVSRAAAPSRAAPVRDRSACGVSPSR